MRIKAGPKTGEDGYLDWFVADFTEMGPNSEEPDLHLELRVNERTMALDHIEKLTIDATGRASITADYLRALADQLDWVVAAAAHTAGAPLEMRLDAVAKSGAKGQRLVEVVEAYQQAAREGLPAFSTAQERLKMSRATLARHVAEARQRGLLPPKHAKGE